MDLLELLKTTEFLIGLMMLIFSLGSGVVVWMHKKQRAVAVQVTEAAMMPLSRTSERIQSLESKVSQLDRDVGEIGNRLGSVERVMEGLARSSDVAELKADLAGRSGAVEAQLRMIGGQLDTLYEAALRASTDKR